MKVEVGLQRNSGATIHLFEKIVQWFGFAKKTKNEEVQFLKFLLIEKEREMKKILQEKIELEKRVLLLEKKLNQVNSNHSSF